jgi:hypothetical protein
MVGGFLNADLYRTATARSVHCCLGATTKKLDEKASLYEGHGFSRVSMSLRLTQGDEKNS